MAQPAPAASTVDDVAQQFLAARDATQVLAAPLSDEDQALQSMADASPTKWHLAHTTWFWERFVLRRYVAGYTPYDASYDYLFNSYYNAVGPRHPRPQRGLLSRPSAADVRGYRAHVDAAMADWLMTAALDADARDLIRLGLAHEEQHQELILTDIKHVFSINPLAPAAYPRAPQPAAATADAIAWRSFPGGVVWIGAEHSGWAYDHETPRHRALLHPFALADRLVTNGEMAAFIEDGGYQTASLWLSDGWSEQEASRRIAPDYWRGAPGAWSLFTLHGETALDPAEPVAHLSYYEADALARWMEARLPREQEWEHAARRAQDEAPAAALGGLLEPGVSAHPRPAADAPEGALRQVFGDVWEWTHSSYEAYPGYRQPDGAVGEYNGKFMCGQYVLRGGSCATPRGHVRASYRNFFPPHARWQFSGVRLARDL